MLEFINVSKKYGNHTALSDANITINDGEFVFLVGESGAGKTTILKLILRDILPTRGYIKLGDIDITKLPNNKLPELRRNLGMIFQDFKILSDRTIQENIALSLEIRGIYGKDKNNRVENVLQIVGLENRKNYFPQQLSAGELQRVAIARAIVGDPKILLADEPTGNLDPKTGWGILKILNEINKRGTTIIMATHNFDIVNSMKKRVLSVTDGTITRDIKRGSYS